jgi:hypothetical protein
MYGAIQFFQTAFIVRNLETAMSSWISTAHIGPFFVMRNVRPIDGLYRGTPATLEMSIAFAQAGPIQIELIEPHVSGPSVYSEMPACAAEGFHHMCCFTDDIDEEFIQRRNDHIQVAYQASAPGPERIRFAYFDTRPTLGFMTEVIERGSSLISLYKVIADAAEAWDGGDPIRELAD